MIEASADGTEEGEEHEEYSSDEDWYDRGGRKPLSNVTVEADAPRGHCGQNDAANLKQKGGRQLTH